MASQPSDSNATGRLVVVLQCRRSGPAMEMSCLPFSEAYGIKMQAPHSKLVSWPTSLVEPSAAVLSSLQPTVPPQGSAHWPRSLAPSPAALIPIPQSLWPGLVSKRAPHSTMLPSTDWWVCTSLADLSLMSAGVDAFLEGT